MGRKNQPNVESAQAWRERRSAWIGGILIAAAGLAAYHNSFAGVFHFDEQKEIIDNEAIRGFSNFGPILWATQRPLVNFTLAVNYAIGGLEVRSYHAFNLFLHICAACTLFGVVRRVLLLNWRQEKMGDSATWIAALTAVIWVVHPLNTQAVTYVIQRAESMMGLFYLLTIYGLLRGAQAEKGTMWYAGSVLACAAGMACKPVMVTAPVVALLFDRTFLSGGFRAALQSRWKWYLGLAATWSVLAVWGVLGTTFGTAPRFGAAAGLAYRGISPVEYALTELWAICTYLRLAVFPYPLCFDYGWPVVRDAATIGWCGTLIGLLLLLTAWGAWRGRWWGFVGASFFLILSPTSSVIPVRDTIVEHRMYLPLAGVVVLVVALTWYGLQRLAKRGAIHSSGKKKIVAATLALGVSGLLTGLTIARNRDYHSAARLWEDVLRKRPQNARAHDQIGTMHDFRRHPDLAIPFYRRALELRPEYVNPRFNLATALIATGKVDEGIAEYRKVLELDGDHPFVRLSLGEALVKHGAGDEGLALLRDGVERTNNEALGHYVLGGALMMVGDLDGAANAYRKSVDLRPADLRARLALAEVLRRMGRRSEAVDEYRRILLMDPQFAPARKALEALGAGS